MNPENRWVKKAATIQGLATKTLCQPISEQDGAAKPLRTALGLLIIQKQYGYADRELLEQITENRVASTSSVFPVISRNRLSHHRFWLSSVSG